MGSKPGPSRLPDDAELDDRVRAWAVGRTGAPIAIGDVARLRRRRAETERRGGRGWAAAGAIAIAGGAVVAVVLTLRDAPAPSIVATPGASKRTREIASLGEVVRLEPRPGAPVRIGDSTPDGDPRAPPQVGESTPGGAPRAAVPDRPGGSTAPSVGGSDRRGSGSAGPRRFQIADVRFDAEDARFEVVFISATTTEIRVEAGTVQFVGSAVRLGPGERMRIVEGRIEPGGPGSATQVPADVFLEGPDGAGVEEAGPEEASTTIEGAPNRGRAGASAAVEVRPGTRPGAGGRRPAGGAGEDGVEARRRPGSTRAEASTGSGRSALRDGSDRTATAKPALAAGRDRTVGGLSPSDRRKRVAERGGSASEEDVAAARVAGSAASPPRPPRDPLDSIRVALLAGEAGAEARLDAYLEDRPADPDALKLAGQWMERAGRLRAAAERYAELARRTDGARRRTARFREGRALHRAGEHAAARRALEAFVTAASPTTPLWGEAKLYLAESLIALGEDEAARAELQSILREQPGTRTAERAAKILRRR